MSGPTVPATTTRTPLLTRLPLPQDCVLFNDTLEYNIAYGRPGCTHADVEAAAAAAQLTDFIASLPAGYNTKVGWPW